MPTTIAAQRRRESAVLYLLRKLRQLGDIGRDPLRLVLS